MTPTLCVNGVVTFMVVTGDDTNNVYEWRYYIYCFLLFSCRYSYLETVQSVTCICVSN